MDYMFNIKSLLQENINVRFQSETIELVLVTIFSLPHKLFSIKSLNRKFLNMLQVWNCWLCSHGSRFNIFLIAYWFTAFNICFNNTLTRPKYVRLLQYIFKPNNSVPLIIPALWYDLRHKVLDFYCCAWLIID